MYTQCSNCGAVFRVNMKELTVAQGKLRCGECDDIFNAMDTLSTTLPKKQDFKSNEEDLIDPDILAPKYTRSTTKKKMNVLPLLTVLALFSLLISQFLYTNKVWFTNELKRNPEQVHMISRNIISHPNDSGVLLITASIENQADHDQPYPYVEVTLMDNKENTIALRRFKPEEYLQHHSKNDVLQANKQATLQLTISDPGKKATRFNFKFM